MSRRMMMVAPVSGGGGLSGFSTLTIDHTKCGASNTTDFPCD